MNSVLRTARKKLKNVTPLKKDCGRVCGAACCRSPEGEETGMLLFPGEEELYAGKNGWRIRETCARWHGRAGAQWIRPSLKRYGKPGVYWQAKKNRRLS